MKMMNEITFTFPEVDRQRVEQHNRDRFIGEQYLKVGSTEDQYAAEPWNHCRDPVKSYLSLRETQRDEFLRKLGQVNPGKKKSVDNEQNHINKARGRITSQPLFSVLRENHEAWRKKVMDEYEDMKKDAQSAEEDCSRPGVHSHHMHHWQTSHLQRLRRRFPEWRSAAPPSDEPPPRQGLGSFFARSRTLNQVRRPSAPSADKEQYEQPHTSVPPDIPDKYYGFNAYAMHFKRANDTFVGETTRDKQYHGSNFPHQKVSMENMLRRSDQNPLTKQCPADSIRYFHFPTNNMAWIEVSSELLMMLQSTPLTESPPQEAIDRYYEGRHEDCERLLAREYWKGQMHGTTGTGTSDGVYKHDAPKNQNDPSRRGGPLHARHMRSKCSLIPRSRTPAVGQQSPAQNQPREQGQAANGILTSSPEAPVEVPPKYPEPKVRVSSERNVALFVCLQEECPLQPISRRLTYG